MFPSDLSFSKAVMASLAPADRRRGGSEARVYRVPPKAPAPRRQGGR